METDRPQKIMIVAHDLPPDDAARALRPLLSTDSEVKVVAPALGTRLEFWTSDVDPGEARARRRLQSWLEALRCADISARGEIGDPDPLIAIDDAWVGFEPDELVLATGAERAHWTEHSLLRRLRRRWTGRVRHWRRPANRVASEPAPGAVAVAPPPC